jgi:putative heme degradation protein
MSPWTNPAPRRGHRELTTEDPCRYRLELARSLEILAAAFAAAGFQADADRLRTEAAVTSEGI